MNERKVSDEQGDQQLAERLGRAGRDQELHDPDTGRAVADRWVNWIAEVIGVAAIATIVALIFLNAVGRYAFAAPILWAEELVIALIPLARHDRRVPLRAPPRRHPHRPFFEHDAEADKIGTLGTR